MSELRVDDSEFHVVETADEEWIVNSEQAAIEKLGSIDIESIDIDPDGEDVKVVKVNHEDGDWAIESLPWQRVAIKLLANQ
jgi:hypothetical protein